MSDRIPSSHAEHDPLLVAAFTAGDLGAADRERAELQTSQCADCALLAADLRAIATATAALPPRVRPRDFSIHAEDAARLRRRGWRGLVRTFAGPGSVALKPLATGLTTIGIAGLLLAALPTIQLGGSAAAPGSGPSGSGGPAAAASGDLPKSVDSLGVASDDPGREGYSVASPPPALVPVTGPAASPVGADRGVADASAVPDRAQSAPPEVAAPAAPAPPVASPLVVLSGTFLIVGLGLFGLRWSARRLGDG